MNDNDHLDQPFSDRLGAAFDAAAVRERRRMDRRSSAQRVALWVIAVVLPIGAFVWNDDRRSDGDATATNPPVSVPMFDDDALSPDRASIDEPANASQSPAGPDTTISTSTDETQADDSTRVAPSDSTSTTSSPMTTASTDPTTEFTTGPPTTAQDAMGEGQTTTSEASTATSAANDSTPPTSTAECPGETVHDRSTLAGDGGDSERAWGDGVTIAAYGTDGLPAAIGTANNTVAVAGGRYGYQIDFESDSGTSEWLEIRFADRPCAVEVVLSHLEVGEYEAGGTTVDESGRWTALDAADQVVSTGVFLASDLPPVGGDHVLSIEFDHEVASLRIEAVAYGAGAHPEAQPNNSDFAVRQLTVR